MPQAKILLKPGIDKQLSQTAREGGWWDCDRVRFRDGMPQKIGGWNKLLTTPVVGVARGINSFSTLAGDPLLGVGTTSHLYIYKGGILHDVTPIDRTLTETNPYSTTSGSKVVSVTTSTAHGVKVGDFISVPSATVGGITIAGDYEVATVPSGTVFTIVDDETATSTATGGGSVIISFYYPAGSQNSTLGLGWGAGGYGSGAYGSPSSEPANQLPPRSWSLHDWGQILLALPTQGRLMYWAPDINGQVTTRAEYVTNTMTPANGPPLIANHMVVATPERHAVLFGCSSLNSLNNFDPMLVRWSDVEDFTIWNATSTNSAGSFRLQGGTQIMGAFNTQLATLIWTDTALHSMQFISLPYVYSFKQIGAQCGLIAPHSYAESDGTVFWMGQKNFFMYQGGGVRVIPCSVYEEVFSGLNTSQAAKVWARVTPSYNEVWWFYPEGDSIEPNRYVVYNYVENIWYLGSMDRTCSISADVFQNEIAVAPDGYIYVHENGVDADGAPMNEFLESGYFDIGDGQEFVYVSSLMPDFQSINGPLNFQVTTTDYPQMPGRTVGPYMLSPTSRNINFRARGRQAALRVYGNELGNDWRLGAFRMNMSQAGRK